MFDIELAVLLFSIIFIVEAISWIGKDTLADIVRPPPPPRNCSLADHVLHPQFYAPIGFFSTSSSSKQSRALKSEILKLRAELAATSAQDEFTKWAKLRRRLDRGVAELETSSTSSSFSFSIVTLLADTVTPSQTRKPEPQRSSSQPTSNRRCGSSLPFFLSSSLPTTASVPSSTSPPAGSVQQRGGWDSPARLWVRRAVVALASLLA